VIDPKVGNRRLGASGNTVHLTILIRFEKSIRRER
jgi:hypothetical protein